MKDNGEQERKEIREAILAGERVLQSLNKADEALRSAKSWGLFDMFGGGLLSTFVKHSRLDRARGYIEDAKQNMKAFKEELADVDQVLDLSVSVGEFLTFADFFFDSFFVDWMVQSKIDMAKRQMQEAIGKVTKILASLREMERDT
ncbi:hypothetical protein D5274_01705 [bacterium 1XD42-94]|nr:hypothetical protein [bacterium 1XD42-76]NBK03917.1 hypothetical protein [bacterium 1XD42-94]